MAAQSAHGNQGGGAAPACCAAPGAAARNPLATIGDRVFFELDGSELTDASRRQIDKWVDFLKQTPGDKLLLEGHADERGTRDYNLALGERRASAVKNYMISLGIPSASLSVTSFGKERPAVVGSSESAWAQNRRVVAVIQP